jgi:hypothetical protein
VLRIGDFFHTKIIPNSLGITYEGLDINPEGIGVQPMLAKITMSFNIIGGMGLKEPVQELQNALSFNYYANTEIYDERATATEDTSKLDKYVVEKITGGLPPVGEQQIQAINSVQPRRGDSTIGTIVDTTVMDYSGLYASLSEKLQQYFKTYYDSLYKINSDYGYGALQIANKNRNYTKGLLSEYTSQKKEGKIYGKTNQYQELVEKLVIEVKKDIENKNDPFTSYLNSPEFDPTAKQIRELQEKLSNIVSQRQNAILDVILNNTTNITNIQNELNYIFRQLDVICSQTDGNMSPSNEPLVYQLSGDTFFGENDQGGIFDVYTSDATYSVVSTINNFETELQTFEMTKDLYKENNSTVENAGNCRLEVNGFSPFAINDCAANRFYILCTPLFTNPEFLTTFINDLSNGPEIKQNTKMVEGIRLKSESLRDNYTQLQNGFKDQFTKKIQETDFFKTATTWKVPDNTVKTCNYLYPATDDVSGRTKKLKDLYSNQNLNQDKQTFNGKVTLN